MSLIGIMMKRKILLPLFDLLIFASIWLVLYFSGRHMLFIQEQLQLFQNDWNYVAEVIRNTGGLARVLTEAVVQFFHVSLLGTFLLALLVMACICFFRGCLRLVLKKKDGIAVLAVAPVIPLIYCSIVCQDTFPIAAFAIAAGSSYAVLQASGKSKAAGVVLAAVLSPIVFHLCGPSAMILPLLYCACMLTSDRKALNVVLAFIPLAAYLGYGYVASRTGMTGSYTELFTHSYPMYEKMDEKSFNVFASVSLYIALAVAVYVAIARKLGAGMIVNLSAGVAVALLAGVFLWASPEKNYAQNVGYKVYSNWAELHHLYSEGKYEDILERYKKKGPENSVESNYINLSLYKTGRLAHDFFRYQPKWQHFSLRAQWIDMQFPFPFIWVEVCDQMGALSKGQQAAFEGNVMAGHKGSAPLVKYLAESEITRGNYVSADKYLAYLENTIYYRKWAQEQRAFLNDEAVAADPHYSSKRACLYDEERTLYDMNDLWLLTEISKRSMKHYSSFEYTGVMTLAAGELETFINFILEMSATSNVLLPLPPIFQDAMIMAFHNKPEVMKLYRIDPKRVTEYREYSAALTGKMENKVAANSIISKNHYSLWNYMTMLANSSRGNTSNKR